MTQEYYVTDENLDQRLDLYLTTIQNSLSRSLIRQKINAGEVMVNDKVEYRPHYRVKLDDKIKISLDVILPQELKLEPENIPIDIVYEDDDLLVVNKPSGMVIHPATGNYTGTLMNAIAFHYKGIKNVGSEIRSGLIHRIDKDTSGLVMIGKTNKGLWYYSKLFAEREVNKTYIAIIAGNISSKIPEQGLVVRNYLGRCPGNRKKYSVVNPTMGRISETKINLLDFTESNQGKFSLVTAMPKTGRTHQIRVHLSNLGFPIVGDVIYGRRNKYSRLMLHAWKIKVKLLNGKTKELIAPIPDNFSEFNFNGINNIQ